MGWVALGQMPLSMSIVELSNCRIGDVDRIWLNAMELRSVSAPDRQRQLFAAAAGTTKKKTVRR